MERRLTASGGASSSPGRDGSLCVAEPEEKVLFFLMMKGNFDHVGPTCLQYLR